MNMLSVKTNFTSGQISENLLGRGDLKIYENGARRLENVIIEPTGGVARRNGLAYVEEISGAARLIPFEFNREQVYLVAVLSDKIRIYKNDVCIKELASPWVGQDISQLSWTQSADTLLVVHSEVAPKQITRNDNEEWKIEDWQFVVSDNGFVNMPYYNFHKNKVTLYLTSDGSIYHFTTGVDIFSPDYIGCYIRMNSGLAKITGYVSPREITGDIVANMDSWNPSTTWEESAFSKVRGWPSTVTFHQNRLVIGGSKSLPNHLWMSKSSDLFNFNLGKGLDDEAIEFTILSDQVNAIRDVVSSRHLLVFTTGAEWMVSGDPLTPGNIQLNRQTTVGSYTKSHVYPQQMDGATIFVSANGCQLREFLYADIEQAYQAKDITLLSNDIVRNPVDSAYSPDSSVLYIVLEDGTISALTYYRTEQVNAWSKLKTEGNFKTVAVVGSDIYFCIERNGHYYLEKFQEELYSDMGKILKSATPKKNWEGLDYLNGREVYVTADGYNLGKKIISNGQLELENNASVITVGIGYEHIIEPLPYMVESSTPHSPKAYRVIYGVFRILDSQTFCIDIGNGYFSVPMNKISKEQKLDAAPNIFSGDILLRSLGWIKDLDKPMWSIKSDEPNKFILLSVVNEIKIKE